MKSALPARLGDALLAGLFPSLCYLCGLRVDAGFACGAHGYELVTDSNGRCVRCAQRLPPALASSTAMECRACRAHAPGFERLFVVGDYTASLREWILGFKHGRRRSLARPLGWSLAEVLDVEVQRRVPVLVPVPLHPLRRLERGFDQAAELTRALAVRTDLPWRRGLRRLRLRPPQGTAGARSRGQNVRGVFGTRGKVPRRVCLVDDVVTSGATLAEAARVLRRGGAREVWAVAVARALPPDPDPDRRHPEQHPTGR